MTLWLGAFGADVTRSSISTAKSEAQTGPIMGDDPSTWAPALAPEDLERAESGATAAMNSVDIGGPGSYLTEEQALQLKKDACKAKGHGWYWNAALAACAPTTSGAVGPGGILSGGTGIPKVLLYGGAAVAAAGVLYLIFRKKG